MAAAPIEAVEYSHPLAVEHRFRAEWARWSSVAIIGLLWLAAILLVWRRLAGALSSPLDLPAIVALAAVLAATAAAARLLMRQDHARRRHRLAEAAVSAPVVLLAAAASLSGTPVAGLILLWVAIAAEEVLAWWIGPRRTQPGLQPPAPSDPPLEMAKEPDTGEPVDEESEEEVPPGEILQQITRSRLADGGEILSGWLRVPLAAGQRSANVHLAFCPPFSQTPQLAVDQRDGPSARIRPIQILPYGARFDLKLAQSCASDTALVLHFVAESAPRSEPEPLAAGRRVDPAGAAQPDGT